MRPRRVDHVRVVALAAAATVAVTFGRLKEHEAATAGIYTTSDAVPPVEPVSADTPIAA